MTTFIKAGAEVQILALGLDGGYICRDLRQDVEIIWRSAETEDSVIVQAQSSTDKQIWTILVHPDDLVNPDVWDGELDLGLVLLDILEEVEDVAPSARLCLLAALRSMVEHDASPEAIMDVWRTAAKDCDSMAARCVRMAYCAAQSIARADEDDNIADRMKTLAGPKEKR